MSSVRREKEAAILEASLDPKRKNDDDDESKDNKRVKKEDEEEGTAV